VNAPQKYSIASEAEYTAQTGLGNSMNRVFYNDSAPDGAEEVNWAQFLKAAQLFTPFLHVSCAIPDKN
jgi:hypothetical protein